MPNKAFNLTEKAVQDISAIWNYTFDYWSERQANLYYNEIIRHCGQIARNPNIVKEYFGIMNSLKGSKINRHIIFYRVMNSGEIEIERILHERMDLKNQM